jgi:acetolactate synthase-1/2/3 large subunit
VCVNSTRDPVSRICPAFIYSPSVDRDALKAVPSMINRCERPIILCGHGVISSNVPVRTAAPLLRKRPISPWPLPCMAFPRMPVDHPVSLGMVGMHGTVEANRALMNADLIISYGHALR